jgi:hypothetical protein
MFRSFNRGSSKAQRPSKQTETTNVESSSNKTEPIVENDDDEEREEPQQSLHTPQKSGMLSMFGGGGGGGGGAGETIKRGHSKERGRSSASSSIMKSFNRGRSKERTSGTPPRATSKDNKPSTAATTTTTKKSFFGVGGNSTAAAAKKLAAEEEKKKQKDEEDKALEGRKLQKLELLESTATSLCDDVLAEALYDITSDDSVNIRNDKDVLIRMYQNLNGDDWKRHHNFKGCLWYDKNKEDFCGFDLSKWHGVETIQYEEENGEEKESVTSLDLHYTG